MYGLFINSNTIKILLIVLSHKNLKTTVSSFKKEASKSYKTNFLNLYNIMPLKTDSINQSYKNSSF